MDARDGLVWYGLDVIEEYFGRELVRRITMATLVFLSLLLTEMLVYAEDVPSTKLKPRGSAEQAAANAKTYTDPATRMEFVFVKVDALAKSRSLTTG